MKLVIKLALMCMLVLMTINSTAQVTTSGISGKVTSGTETIVGATIVAVHTPSGTQYGTVSNLDGNYSIVGMRVGGPYNIVVSYVGYSTYSMSNVYINLGENFILNAQLVERGVDLQEVFVVGISGSTNMSTERSGAITSVNRAAINSVPTISRSMNDIMRLSPQSSMTSNGYAVGGGNYRQSHITVDGAAYNNAFGIGANLPAGGAPISLDALEQLTVSVTPYDVRQSGFVGGAINAVTRSGDNDVKGTAYSYLRNETFQGKMVGDYELTAQQTRANTHGISIGGPIIKNKLFYFLNAEYEDNVSPGPSFILRENESQAFGSDNVIRPLQSDVDAMTAHLKSTYNYDPGRITNYQAETPAFRLLGRFDWNINESHKLNLRLSHTSSKDSRPPSGSTSPLTARSIYPGNTGLSINHSLGRTSNYSMYYESSRYFQEQNFSSVATELNSKLFGNKVNNMFRVTYSYQNEPRSYVGGAFPTVDILKDGASYMSFGPDPFTAGNTRVVNTIVVTDEASWNWGIHSLTAGLQYEYQKAVNGFMQGGNGYYVFASMNDFINGAKPSAFGITHSNSEDLSQFKSELAFQQYSAYLQNNMKFSDNFRMTAGIRLELPSYPSIESTNFNQAFNDLDFGGEKYSTAQLPAAKLTFSPRVGFNWDITGERKYVLRGGSGVFVGRLPYVWLVSVVGNSNVGQTQYFYNRPADAADVQPDFNPDLKSILSQLYGGSFTPAVPRAPQSPTILSTDLKMPATWKSSLAFDAKLPGNVDFTLEGIYNNDFNPVVINNKGLKESGTLTLNPNDIRKTYASHINNQNAFMIMNKEDSKAYYYSLSAQLRKKFDVGLDLSVAYTRSNSKAYSDGIGDQVTSAFNTNLFSVNGINDHELGYGTYVAPDRVIATVGYKKDYARNFSTGVYLIYDGSQHGYAGSFSYTRYSYTMSNVVNDRGANNLLYIPATKAELDTWEFADATNYSGAQQRDDFWAFIEQDKYLSSRKGEYAERGGAIMPWRSSLDLKVVQDIFVNVGGKRNTLQLGVDVSNLPNLINSNWGLYKQVRSSNILSYSGGKYSFPKVNNEVLTSTFRNYESFRSTYSMQFSLRYIFN
jgi:hypothetical protein